MFKHIYTFSLLMLVLCSQNLHAQNQLNALVVDEEEGTPLIGATFFAKSIEKGGITNTKGLILIEDIPAGEHQFQISYIGYEPKKVQIKFPLERPADLIIFKLHHQHSEMEEVVITSTRSSRTIEDIPTRVEFIAGEELAEKGNMKPGDIRMLLNESTGIRTQQTSATSYNSSIRIQGLDGKYTQLLRDGLPLYSGFSGSLSLMQIAPLDLMQVEVIKGANSTLYGGGAIAGLVNLISKAPKEKPELSFMLNGTSALGLDVSGFYAKRKEKIGTTVFASYNRGTAYDPANIGLTAIPEFDRFTLNPKLFLYPSEDTEVELGVNLVTERRLGGNIAYVKGEEVNDPYFELNETDRMSSQLIIGHQFRKNLKLNFKNSLNYFDRKIGIPAYTFSGLQFSSFSELNLTSLQEKSEWIMGVNLWTESFDQQQGQPGQDIGFQESTVGAFLQHTVDLSQDFSVEGGIRLDYNNQYGLFPLPRVAIMYKPAEQLTFRLGGGLGYKTPTVFSEEAESKQFQNISALDRANLSAEKSAGANFDIGYRMLFSDELSLSTNTLLFYTQIQDPLQLMQVGNNFEFQQLNGYIQSKGAEVNLKWAYKDFKFFTGYTYVDVNVAQQNNVSQMPLVANHRLNNVLMYEQHGNFWLGLEGYYFSPQKLNDGATGQAYWIFGLMSEKRFSEHFSIFLNFENFTDTRQTHFDNIYTGSLEDPEFRDIYAPVDGFVINGGIKLNLL